MTAAQFDIAFALISQIYRVVAETRTAHPNVDVEVAGLRLIFRAYGDGGPLWQALVLVGCAVAEPPTHWQQTLAYAFARAETVDAAFAGLVLALNQRRAEAGP